MFQGQIRKVTPLSTEKLGIFLILALVFNPPLPKIGHSHPIRLETTFSNRYGKGLSSQKVSL